MWQAVLFLHLAGVAIWIGGQVTVLLVAPILRTHEGDRAAELMGVIGRRFGAVAGASLLLVIATGLLQAWHIGWSPADATDGETYRIVTEKMALVAVMVVLTAVHAVVGARIARGAVTGPARARLRLVSVANLALGFVVLWLAAGL